MTIETKTKYGSISNRKKEIADVVSGAGLACYGVVGNTKRNSLRDAIIKKKKKGNFSQGIFVSQDKRNVTIDLYVVIAYDVKITEVIKKKKKRVKYIVSKTFNLSIKKINVFAHSLKKVN